MKVLVAGRTSSVGCLIPKTRVEIKYTLVSAYDLRAGEVEKRVYTGAHWTSSSAELTRSRFMKDLASKARQRR